MNANRLLRRLRWRTAEVLAEALITPHKRANLVRRAIGACPRTDAFFHPGAARLPRAVLERHATDLAPDDHPRAFPDVLATATDVRGGVADQTRLAVGTGPAGDAAAVDTIRGRVTAGVQAVATVVVIGLQIGTAGGAAGLAIRTGGVSVDRADTLAIDAIGRRVAEADGLVAAAPAEARPRAAQVARRSRNAVADVLTADAGAGLTDRRRVGATVGVAGTDATGLADLTVAATRLAMPGGIDHAGAWGGRPLLASEALIAAGIAGARPAVDASAAIVLDRPAFAGADLRARLGAALALALAMAAAGLAVLVRLLAALAPAPGLGVVELQEREEPAQEGQRGQQPEQAPARSGGGERFGEQVEVTRVHPSSRGLHTPRRRTLWPRSPETLNPCFAEHIR
jgi:hypothetical protein